MGFSRVHIIKIIKIKNIMEEDAKKMVPVLDEHGAPMLNADGTPMMKEVEASTTEPVADPAAEPAEM